MKVRRFEAASIHDALQRVRRELGPDAVIFQTRKLKKGGFFGLFGKNWAEITAGVDVDKEPRTSAPPAGASPFAPVTLDRPIPTGATGDRTGDLPTARGTLLAGYAPTKPRDGGFKPWVPDEAMPSTFPANPLAATESPAAAGRMGEIEKQIAELKILVSTAIGGASASAARVSSSEFSLWVGRLRRLGVEEETARKVVAAAESRAAAGDSARPAEDWVVEEIGKMLRVAPPLAVPGDGRPRVMAFIGPTGVGKTTTIAKIAARYFLNEGKKVALVTADTYRIAAVQQLKGYGEIMGLPVEVVNTPQDLREALVRQSDKDLLLLDTAGRSPQNAQQIQELRELFLASQADEVHLVVSVTTRFHDMLDILGKFGVIPIQRLLLTKLDETRAPGVALDLAAHFPIPVCWLSTGQGVPADLVAAERDALARRVAGLAAAGSAPPGA